MRGVSTVVIPVALPYSFPLSIDEEAEAGEGTTGPKMQRLTSPRSTLSCLGLSAVSVLR